MMVPILSYEVKGRNNVVFFSKRKVYFFTGQSSWSDDINSLGSYLDTLKLHKDNSRKDYYYVVAKYLPNHPEKIISRYMWGNVKSYTRRQFFNVLLTDSNKKEGGNT